MPNDSVDIQFSDVQAAYDDALLLADRGFIQLIAASVLANQLDGAPVWLMIVAPSSGGKTSVLLTLDELEFITGKRVTFFISDLTENTLASGFKSSTGEASLLKQMPYGGMLIFKDFTSLLTKRHESRDAIMGQLREVYDRKFDKKTGNNQDVAWTGKVGAIAGVTTIVHEHMQNISVMGDRFIMYSPVQPPRMDLLEFIMKMKVDNESQEKKLLYARTLMQSYLRRCMKGMAKTKMVMDEKDRKSLMHIADFATRVRSGIVTDDRKGRIMFVPEPEMPTRLIEQVLSIGTVLSHMHVMDGDSPLLTQVDMAMLYKLCFDSIPIKRRWALRQLARYVQGVTTAGVATTLGYETDVVKEWMAQLNALGICRRLKNSGSGDLWLLNDEYAQIMITFEHVQTVNGALTDEDASEDNRLADEALRDYGDLASEFDRG